MAKAKRIIDAIRQAPVMQPGVIGWWTELQKTNPTLLDEINEAIDAWNDNDPDLLSRCPSKRSLATRLIEHGLPIKKPETVIRYILHRERQRGNQR